MFKRYVVVSGLALTLLWNLPAQAQSRGISAGVKAGTLGAGVEATIGLNDWIGLRLGANALQFSMSETIDDIDYDADLSLRNASALLDVYPFGGIFRLTGGVLLNGNEFEVEGRTSAQAVINGHSYTAQQLGTLTGKAEFETWAPYLGLGWSSRPENQPGWGVAFDLGVVFQGTPEISPLAASGTMGNDPRLQADLEQERADVVDELDSYRYYPVISLMVQYSF